MTTRRNPGILTGMPFMAHVAPRTFVDSRGHKVFLAGTPRRIVSLAPSLTEILYAIGAGDRVVGVTEFCDFPPDAKTKPKVGYAQPSLEALVALKPDLVVTPTEFLKADLVTQLERLKIPLMVLASETIDEIVDHVTTLGRMLNQGPTADAVAMSIRQRVADVKAAVQGATPVRVLYVLNSQPLITVGPKSFIDQLITSAGGSNIAGDSAEAYPRLSLEAVLQRDPEVLLFPTGKAEGVAEREQQTWRRWDRMSAVKHDRLRQIPADLLNRPGPRVADGIEQLAALLHPERFGAPPRRPEAP
ncbi:MAG: cobalamin-binding protein [Nitrospiraceae bacterium]